MKEAGHNPTGNHILSIIGKTCLLPYENMHTQPPQLRTGLVPRKVQHINNVNFQHRVSQKHILLLSPNRDANVSNTTECFQHFVSPEIKWSVQTVSGQQNASNQLQETGKLLSFLKLSEQKKTSRFSSHSTWSSRPSDFSTDDLRCLLSDDLILLFNSQDTPTPEQGSWIHKGTSKNNEMIRHIVLGFSAEMGKLTATHFVNNWIRKGADNQSQDQYYGQQVELLNFLNYDQTVGTNEFSEQARRGNHAVKRSVVLQQAPLLHLARCPLPTSDPKQEVLILFGDFG